MSAQEAYINIHKIISLGHSECLAFPASTVNIGKGQNDWNGIWWAKPQSKNQNFIWVFNIHV